MVGTPTIQQVRSHGLGLSTRRKVSITDKIFTIEPYENPATLVLSKLPKKPIGQMSHTWLYDEYTPVWDNINDSTYTDPTTDTTVVVDHGSYWRAGDLGAAVANGKIQEIFSVTSVSTNTLTIVRNWVGDGVTGTTFADNMPLLILGSAWKETGLTAAGAIGTGRSVTEVAITNYLQYYIDWVEWTEIQENLDLYGGKDRAYQQNKKMKELTRQIERTFFFGSPKEDTATDTSYDRWATGGAYYFINTYASGNIWAVNGTLTKKDLYGKLRTMFKYGNSNTRFLYASPMIAEAINWFADNDITYTPNDKLGGLAIGKWQSPIGLLNIVIHKMFEDPATGVGTAFGGFAIMLDMADINYLHLNNMDLHLEPDVVQDGSSLHKDKLQGVIGFEFNNPWNHAVIENVTDYSV